MANVPTIELPLAAPPRLYDQPSLSPDGQQVAVSVFDGDQNHIWVYDISLDTLKPLTFEGDNSFPLWTPDGKSITFQSTRLGPQDLFWKPADGTGATEQLLVSALSKSPHSWSPDGKILAFTEFHPTSVDIWVLQLDQDEWKREPFLTTPVTETGAVFSPDGHWLAYRSNESGRQEIYVQPFPATGAKWQISAEGGEEAAWAGSGREIFYRNGGKMMSVDVTTEPTFTGQVKSSRPDQSSQGFTPYFPVCNFGVYPLQVAKGSRVPRLVGFAAGLTRRLLSQSPVVRIALLGRLAA